MPIRQATTLDLSLMIVTMAIWGAAFVAMKIAVPETGPYWLAVARIVLGLIAVAPFVIWAGIHLPKDKRQWMLLMVVVLLNTTTPLILISWAQLTLSAGVAALLMGTGPFLALFIGNIATTDEKFTFAKLIAVMMGFSGVVAVVGPSALLDVGSGHLIAQGVLMLSSLMYVTAGFTIRKIDVPPLSLAFLTLLVGSVILIPISLAVSGPPPTDISANALGWLVFVGIFGTGLGFVSRFYLISRIGYSMFSIGINLIPAFGVVFGAIILGEDITFSIALALMLIVGGLFVARLGSKPG